MSSINDRGPTVIRAGEGWTAVGERFAAGGPTVAEALAKYWEMAKASDDEPVLLQEEREAQ